MRTRPAILVLVILFVAPRPIAAPDGQYGFTSSSGSTYMFSFSASDIWLTNRPNTVDITFGCNEGAGGNQRILPETLTVKLVVAGGRDPTPAIVYYQSNETLSVGQTWSSTLTFFFTEADLRIQGKVNTTATLQFFVGFKEYRTGLVKEETWNNTRGETPLPQIEVQSPAGSDTTVSTRPPGTVSLQVVIASWIGAGIAVGLIVIAFMRWGRSSAPRPPHRK